MSRRPSAISAIHNRQGYWAEVVRAEFAAWRIAHDNPGLYVGWQRWADGSVERRHWEAHEKAVGELMLCVLALRRLGG